MSPQKKLELAFELYDTAITFGGYYIALNHRAGRRKAVRAVRQWLLEECMIFGKSETERLAPLGRIETGSPTVESRYSVCDFY